jgi:glucosamine 6-phosphate synthetase-like amidotransferase/phosphosugar isomerase protein
MCGIVGIVGVDEVAPLLVKSIAGLEYRGYDSCAVATLGPTGVEVREGRGVVRRRATPDLTIWEFRIFVANRRGAEGADQKTIFLNKLSANFASQW